MNYKKCFLVTCPAAVCLLISIFFFGACDEATDTVSDATSLGGIWGLVTGIDGLPLEGVTVKVINGFGSEKITDKTGIFILGGAALEDKMVLSFEKEGFNTIHRSVDVFASVISSMEVRMKKADKVVTFNAAQDLGQDIAGGSGILITGGSLIDEEGQPVVGDVTATLTAFDVSDEDQLFATPGNFSAQTNQGEFAILETFGMISIELKQGDQKVYLGTGQTSLLEFGLPGDTTKQPGDVIPLWYYDEETGDWIEDGECEVSDQGTCIGEVNHFSDWNTDDPITTSCFRGRTVDKFHNPVGGVEVAAFGRSYDAITDTTSNEDGEFVVPIKSASVIDLRVTKEDKDRLYEEMETPEYAVDYVYSPEQCEDIDDISIDGEFDDSGRLNDLFGDDSDDPEEVLCGAICG